MHAKALTVRGLVAFMGSTNLDLRNFEKNLLLQDATTTAAIVARQQVYIARAVSVAVEQVRAWPRWRRMWNNALATLGPVI